MSPHVDTLYGANTDVLARATFKPTSTTSGARLVPASWLIASTSCWLLPFGLSEVTLSLPSAFAAVTRADMPPTSAADFADAAPTVDGFDDPHAASTSRAATPRARPRIRYRQLIPLSPNDG